MYIINDVVDRGGLHHLKFAGYHNKNANPNFITEVIARVSSPSMI